MADISNSAWNEEDNLNNSPPPNGLPTGSQPSTLAPTIRDIRGAIKRFWNRSNAILVSTGTAAAFALTYDVGPTGYVKGETFAFFAHVDNSGALTLNINSLGAKSVVRADGVALGAGQIKAGQGVMVVYDGTNFRLLSPTINNPAFAGTLTAPAVTVSGALNAGTLSAGTLSGNGSGLTNVNAATVGGIAPATVVQTTRTLTAGNGLSGGGTLAADRAFALGTPSTITTSTTNTVSAASHTHELTLVAADINNALGYTPAGTLTTITAGNGLTGGGNIGTHRTITLGTPATITNSTTNSVSAASHTHAISLTAADVGAPSTSIQVIAGNGLSGGGTLAANRTITLATPGTLTNSTTNAVSANSHTHVVDFNGALASMGHNVIGTYGFMNTALSPAITPGTTTAGANLFFSNAGGSGSVYASGTWRCMGYMQPGADHSRTLWKRIS